MAHSDINCFICLKQIRVINYLHFRALLNFLFAVGEVEKKMGSLRTTFGRKIPKKSGSSRTASLPSWIAKKMEFLRRHIRHRKKTVSSLDEVSTV